MRPIPFSPPPAGARRLGRRNGFSLVEVIIAALLMLAIILGLLPLFARSVLSNASGADSTQISNFSKSTTEALLQAPFNSTPVLVAGGTTELVTVEYWDDANKRFTLTAPAAGDPPRWTRTTRVRQFSIEDLDDGVLNDPKDGGTDPNFIHLKEVEVEVVTNPDLYGGGRRILIKTLKSF